MPGEWVAVGRILRPHGLRGELKVEPLTDNPRRFEPGNRLLVRRRDGETVEVEVEKVRPFQNRFLLVVFSGCQTLSGAEGLSGGWVLVPEEDLPALPEGRYYLHQILGMEVFEEGSGTYLGKVEEIIPTGSNDVYVVRKGKTEHLIPGIPEAVAAVDVAGGKMIVRLLEEAE
ncbi:MAG: 16S rRNA processing protein RimM [Nitrospirae bacterium]|nr:16S rRNA processing protein RimM [Nitrospirota bacterium]